MELNMVGLGSPFLEKSKRREVEWVVEVEKEDYLSDITEAVALEILMKLNVRSIVRLGVTSKHWKELNNKDYFWREFLIRNFDNREVGKVAPGQYKGTYIDSYKKARFFISNLPKSDFLLKYSENDNSLLAYGFLDLKGLDGYISKLTGEEINKVFLESSVFGCVPMLRAILNHEGFSSAIMASPSRVIGAAFIAAAS
jgi:hypothetical protein